MTSTRTTTSPASSGVAAVQAMITADPHTLILDVRTPGEFDAARIPDAVNLPVDQLPAHAAIVAAADRRVVLVCQSGPRAVRAAGLLDTAQTRDVVVLDGGMNAWIAAGAPVDHGTRARWTLERQVRLVAGGIVASSVLGSRWYPPLRYVAGGVGAGLVVTALTDTCAMGSLLAKLPHNRGNSADVNAALAAIHRSGRSAPRRISAHASQHLD